MIYGRLTRDEVLYVDGDASLVYCSCKNTRYFEVFQIPCSLCAPESLAKSYGRRRTRNASRVDDWLDALVRARRSM